jgi:isochorismate synthase EntC
MSTPQPHLIHQARARPYAHMDMLAPIAILEHLEARLADALARLRLADKGAVQSVLLPLPRAPAAAPQLAGRQFQFQHAQRGELHAGYGEAIAWQAAGPARLRALADALAETDWRRADPDDTGFDAFAMLGFAAGDEDAQTNRQPAALHTDSALPNAILWVPEVGLVCRDYEAALVFSTPLPAAPDAVLARWGRALRQLLPALYQPVTGPLTPARLARDREEPDAAGWTGLVQAALAHIDAGPIEKVVLSRRLLCRVRGPSTSAGCSSALGCLFPSCQT